MDDAEIVERADAFERGTLSPSEWTHAAHLTTALVFVRRYGEGGAAVFFCAALRRYLAAVGGQASAFHETITRAWLAVVVAFDRERPDAPLADAARALVERCGRKEYLHRYYSPERLKSAEARAAWVEPDLAPL